jgi:hypothetical protein
MKVGAQCLALMSALCLSPNCFCAADRADEIKQAFLENATALRAHSDGFGLDRDPGSPALLDLEWALLADWVVAYLNNHRLATAREMDAALHELDGDLYHSVIELRPHTFVVAANRVEIGTFFIVSESSGEYRLVWNVKDFAATHDGQGDDLSHWSAHAKGALFGKVAPLFDDENGNSRFYVNAIYQGEGFTVGKQLSIWEWDGATATPILTGNYAYFLDSIADVTFDGKLLRAYTKVDNFKTFFSCGGCPEPPGEWTIRVTSRGVEDLGRRLLSPELDLVDNLFYRIQRRMPASDMASADVIEDLTDAIDDIREDKSVTNDYSPLGMLMDWKVERKDQHMRICIETDNLGLYLFTLVQRNRRWVFTEDLDSDDLEPAQNCPDAMRLGH